MKNERVQPFSPTLGFKMVFRTMLYQMGLYGMTAFFATLTLISVVLVRLFAHTDLLSIAIAMAGAVIAINPLSRLFTLIEHGRRGYAAARERGRVDDLLADRMHKLNARTETCLSDEDQDQLACDRIEMQTQLDNTVAWQNVRFRRGSSNQKNPGSDVVARAVTGFLAVPVAMVAVIALAPALPSVVMFLITLAVAFSAINIHGKILEWRRVNAQQKA